MADSKITFAEIPTPSPIFLESIRVISEEVRKSFALGFDKAIEFYRTMAMPPEQPRMNGAMLNPAGAEEEEDFSSIPDLAAVWNMPPEMREAMLSRYGLQAIPPASKPHDPTHDTMRDTIKNDGLEPPGTGEPGPEEGEDE